MVEITSHLRIDERELTFDFIRSAGPGGQNVNKVATAVQLRYDLRASSLPEEVQKRLVHLSGRRVTSAGVLIIEAKRFRTQEQNRSDALGRFTALVRKASERPKARQKTKPTKSSQEKRLKSKKIRSEIKRGRRESFRD